MTKVSQLNYFAAVPARALSDDRLSALDLRVLMAICAHDRMSRNGQCCWAGRKKLSKEVKCHEASLSRSLSLLCDIGYVERINHEDDKRRKGFRVIYNRAADSKAMGVKEPKSTLQDCNLNSQHAADNRLQDCNANDQDRLQDCNLNHRDRLQDRNAYNANKRRFSQSKQQLNTIAHNPNIFSETDKHITRSGAGEKSADVASTPLMPDKSPQDDTSQWMWGRVRNVDLKIAHWLEIEFDKPNNLPIEFLNRLRSAAMRGDWDVKLKAQALEHLAATKAAIGAVA